MSRLEPRWYRLSGAVAAAALFGISRAVPATGFGLWLRLAAATLVLLLPGAWLARCLGQRALAATLAWSAALVGCALALTFAIGGSIDVALAFTLAAGAVALGALVAGSHVRGPVLPGRGRFGRIFFAVAGLVFGGAMWGIHGVLAGDSFFHLGRIRKLDDLGSLSLHNVGEFLHGGLHPGYAFPLWHGWMAFVARLADVDPTSVATHESSLLVPVTLVLFFELGLAVFGSTGAAVAVVLAQLALKGLAAGHAGDYALLWQPGTAATQLFAPAAVALFFWFLRRPSWPLALTLAADSAALALVHPTYALFLAIPLVAFVVVRALFTRGTELRPGVAALASFVIPTGLAFAWLRPVVDQTLSLTPGPHALAESLQIYRPDLVIHSLKSYALAPGRVDRAGSVAVAAVVLAPLALFARRSRWSALVIGGTVAILALELWPFVFPHFADAVSLSQARRAAIFVPFAIAFAGAAVVIAALSRFLALALALGGGLWLELAFAGDFGRRITATQPAVAVWIGFYGAAAALVIGAVAVWLRRDPIPSAGPSRGVTVGLAALLFVLPTMVHGFSAWTPSKTIDRKALTPGLIGFLQNDAAPDSVVFADLETSYRATAFAPVYVVAVPPSHTANTKPNRIFVRKRAVLRFFAQPSFAIPERWHADWLVLRKDDEHAAVQAIEGQGASPVYADSGFVVFKVPAAPLP
jgi:hypothetical protein